MGSGNEDNDAKPELVEKNSDIGSNKGDDAEVTYSDVVMVSAVSASVAAFRESYLIIMTE